MIITVTRRELALLFASPLAWIAIALVQFLLAWTFFTRIQLFMENQAQIAALEGAPGLTDLVVAPLFGTAALILLLLTPMLSMRSFAEEARSGTLVALLAAPIKTRDLLLGKFLGLMCIYALQITLLTLMCSSLLLGGGIDLGQFFACILALFLLSSSFAAIGLFTSTLTRQPAVAAVTAGGLLLLGFLLGLANPAVQAGNANLLGYLSLLGHYQSLLSGFISSADVAFYLIITTLFLALGSWRLEFERASG